VARLLYIQFNLMLVTPWEKRIVSVTNFKTGTI